MILWVWLAIYITAIIMVPIRKEHKGYGWSFLRKTVFRLIPHVYPDQRQLMHQIIRFLIVYVALYVVAQFVMDDNEFILPYTVIIVLCMDDYLNGDDDTKRKQREWARNKIKWLMELPSPPQEAKVRA